MRRVISEDAMRRALARMDEEQSRKWLRPALMRSVSDALDQPWILDIDATIKTLFGHQVSFRQGDLPAGYLCHFWWLHYGRVVV